MSLVKTTLHAADRLRTGAGQAARATAVDAGRALDSGFRGTSASFNVLSLFMILLVISTGAYLETRARLAAIEPPQDWAEKAKPSELLSVPGWKVAYWGDPDAGYAKFATRRKKKPVAIVVHFTKVVPVLAVLRYGHLKDFSRGGGSYGYHFYVGRGGGIAQGAPLSKRTNHIKSKRRRQRTKTAKHLWSGNTIAVSLVGGCDWLLRPKWRGSAACSAEYSTEAQLKAGLAVIRALQERYDIPCKEVYGHGQLQTDRQNFEGGMLTRIARGTCPEVVAKKGSES